MGFVVERGGVGLEDDGDHACGNQERAERTERSVSFARRPCKKRVGGTTIRSSAELKRERVRIPDCMAVASEYGGESSARTSSYASFWKAMMVPVEPSVRLISFSNRRRSSCAT